MQLCLFGLFRPFLDKSQKIKKDETDNYYTCVALRAAGKNTGLRCHTLTLTDTVDLELQRVGGAEIELTISPRPV